VKRTDGYLLEEGKVKLGNERAAAGECPSLNAFGGGYKLWANNCLV
jgi:hypothetical protein